MLISSRASEAKPSSSEPPVCGQASSGNSGIKPTGGGCQRILWAKTEAGRGFHTFCPVIIRCGHRTRTVFSRYPTVRVNHPKRNVNGQMRKKTQFTRLITKRRSPPTWRSSPFTTAFSTPRCARIRAPSSIRLLRRLRPLQWGWKTGMTAGPPERGQTIVNGKEG